MTMKVIKKASIELKRLADDAKKSLGTADEKVRKAYNYAVEVDGFSPKEAKDFLIEYLELSRRTIYNFIPREAIKEIDTSIKKMKKEAKSLINVGDAKLHSKTLNTNDKKKPKSKPPIVGKEEEEAIPSIEEEKSSLPSIVSHFNDAVNVYLEALTGFELGDQDDGYSKSHAEDSKELRKEIIDSMNKGHCKGLMKELLLIQSLNDEMIKLMEKKLTK